MHLHRDGIQVTQAINVQFDVIVILCHFKPDRGLHDAHILCLRHSSEIRPGHPVVKTQRRGVVVRAFSLRSLRLCVSRPHLPNSCRD
jgi:hypothetical protein